MTGPLAQRGAPGYKPVPLGEACNAGTSILGDGGTMSLGARPLRGIPFQIADDPGRCFVLLEPSRPVAIPVDDHATWVIIAHRVVGSRILTGDIAGGELGRYVFRYRDGGAVDAPIRERLEVSFVQTSPEGWGQLPLLALPDRFDASPSRYTGMFAATGHRLTDVQLQPTELFLWAWRNPEPSRKVSVIELHGAPTAARLVVAGISLSTLDEHPLRLPPARPVGIEIARDTSDPARDLTLQVDRGIATYTHPLRPGGRSHRAPDPLTGWGEPRERHGKRVFSYVAALPSATITVRDRDRVLGEATWAEIAAAGDVEAGQVRIHTLEDGRNWVRTTVVDDATGDPLPCRIHFSSPAGVPYQPHGHHDHVNSDLYERSGRLGTDQAVWNLDVGGDLRLGRITYAYIDGRCEGWLPRGEVLIDAAQGFEYEPLRTTVRLEPGQRELTIRLKRVSDAARDGWYSGDTHVHFLSVDGAHLEARGEGLNVVNLLASQWGRLFTNTEDLTGRASVSPDGRTIVHVSQENRQHALGHLSLLGLKRPVTPWCTDGAPEAELGGSLESGLAHWADQCHQQGGLVVLPHFPAPYSELAALVATGRADAAEFVDHRVSSHHAYYRYLNAGYRLALVGGTDKMSGDVPVGVSRTYAHIPSSEPFTFEAWCRAIAAGRTFMSSGPLIFLRIDGALPGGVIRVRGGGRVHVEVAVTSIFPVHELQLVQAGRVVATASSASGTKALALREDVTVTEDTWFAARVAGPGYTAALRHRDDWTRGVMAHTSPIYVTCGEVWRMRDDDALREMAALIEGGLRYIRELSPQWEDDRVTHHHGGDHSAWLERPFLEGRAAVQARIGSAT